MTAIFRCALRKTNSNALPSQMVDVAGSHRRKLVGGKEGERETKIKMCANEYLNMNISNRKWAQTNKQTRTHPVCGNRTHFHS